MTVIDYDQIDEWGPEIGAMVAEIAPPNIGEALLNAQPEYLQDAAAVLCNHVHRDRLIKHLEARLEPYSIRVYHGTRVTDADAEQIRIQGLKPLRLADRKSTLAAVFAQHPRWAEVELNLEAAVHRFGLGGAGGRREDGCVHVCFSRAGLLYGCNHYLTHGAEVDRHIAHHLFRDETALSLLRGHRRAKLVSFLSDFSEAARGADPNGFPTEGLPSLLRMLVQAWAYRHVHPDFTVVSQRDCTAAKFKRPVPASEIERIEDVDDHGLDHRAL